MEIFAEKLKELRIKNNLTTYQLAKEINVSPTAITRWEKNQREPAITNLYNLSKFFHVSSDYLLGLTEE